VFSRFLLLVQNTYLIGDKGLLPASAFLKNLKSHLYSHGAISSQQNLDIDDQFILFKYCPTLIVFFESISFDIFITSVSITGLIISSFILLTGLSNSILLAILWILYHSIVNIGQRFYSFGWESQLLESGFLAIFIVPLFKIRKIGECDSTFFGLLCYRWLIFRIMIGAVSTVQSANDEYIFI